MPIIKNNAEYFLKKQVRIKGRKGEQSRANELGSLFAGSAGAVEAGMSQLCLEGAGAVCRVLRGYSRVPLAQVRSGPG